MNQSIAVPQVLEILELYYSNQMSGDPTSKALQSAIRVVAEKYGYTERATEDGLRRRLFLKNMGQLRALLEKWKSGEPGPLLTLIKDNSRPHSYPAITRFFGSRMRAASVETTSMPEHQANSESPETTVISVEMLNADLVGLDRLASKAGVPRLRLASKLLSEAISDKLHQTE